MASKSGVQWMRFIECVVFSNGAKEIKLMQTFE
jgi:hypothetical protein